jgi:transcriptional regulator with XRE-family HTH domain
VGGRRFDEFDRQIGQLVKARRLSKGISQGELGQILGLTEHEIQNYESGSKSISASRLAQISEALDVPVTFFYDDTEGYSGLEAGHVPADPAQMLKTILGLRLLRAFHNLQDHSMREHLVRLAEQMSANAVSTGKQGRSDPKTAS